MKREQNNYERGKKKHNIHNDRTFLTKGAHLFNNFHFANNLRSLLKCHER